MALIELRKITKRFGGLFAVKDLDLEINKGELLGLIGPNGAGKTTVINMISGIYCPNGGNILFKGEEIIGIRPHEIVRKGIARTFQLGALFGDLTVLENALLGATISAGLGIGFIDTFRAQKNRRKELERKATAALELANLAGMKEEIAKNLPHGLQKLLAIAVALATEPEILLLDEPASGMSHKETMNIMDTVNLLRKGGGISILLVEHNMRAVMGYCDRISVLAYGKKIAEGLPEEIRHDEEVIVAYLGKEVSDA